MVTATTPDANPVSTLTKPATPTPLHENPAQSAPNVHMVGKLVKIMASTVSRDAFFAEWVGVLGGYGVTQTRTSWFFQGDASPEGYSVENVSYNLEIIVYDA